MKQHNEKNLEAEILQRIAQQMNDIAEQIAAFALDCAAAMRRVLESKALQEALQAALQEIQAGQALPLGSFAEVAAHMEGAHGQNRYQVGDIIQMNHDDFGLIKWRVIGVDVDQSGESTTVITSAMKGLADSAQWALGKFYAGEFASIGGVQTSLGANENAVGLPTATWSLTKWSVDSYKVMLQDIKDGKIAIDNNYDNLASTENVTLNIVG